MTKVTIIGRSAAPVFVGLALAVGYWVHERDVDAAAALSPPTARPAAAAAEAHQGVLYGRITTVEGATYEGRLRFGGDEEAFWGDYFNGFKAENPWVEHLPREGGKIRIFGLEVGHQESVGRPFMARFGDIARIEARGRDLTVTLKSGTVFQLDRYAADDFADGVRVWDGTRGVLDFGERRIRAIDLLPAGPDAAAPPRLHGTVRTRHGEFTGYLQWNRKEGVALDELDGRAADGELVGVPFHTIRSIARRSSESAAVTLRDGREIVLSDTPEVGQEGGGVYVDDVRYGRVLVSWDAFEHAELSAAGTAPSGPAYGDFPPGRALMGSVTTRAGHRLAGRLVFDLDESEITETLDAPSRGVDYTIPLGLVASIVLAGGEAPATVTLRSGAELRLERRGDLGDGNAGLLIFVDGLERPEHVPWADVARVDFDGPPAP